MKRVEKPWGDELIWAHTDKYVGKMLNINAGSKLSLQYHEVKEETIYVLKGTLILHHGESENSIQQISLEEGSTFHVKPGYIHRFEAGTDCTLIEVSTPELDDVVRLKDDYGRQGT